MQLRSTVVVIIDAIPIKIIAICCFFLFLFDNYFVYCDAHYNEHDDKRCYELNSLEFLIEDKSVGGVPPYNLYITHQRYKA